MKRLRALVAVILILPLPLVAPPSSHAAYSTNLVVDWAGYSLSNATSPWVDGVASKSLTQYNTTYSSNNGGYLSFNGSSSYVKADSSNDLPTFTTTTMSMFFWIKPTANAGVIMVLGRDINPNDADSEMWLMLDSSGKLLLWDYNGGDGIASQLSTSTVTLNAWNYVGFTKAISGSNSNLTFYINGAAAGTATGTSKSVSLNSFGLGKDVRDNTRFYSGAIARATVWSSALTSSEVSANYQATNGIAIAPSISITNATQSVNANSAIATVVASNTGGAVASYSISPSLPSGLSLDVNTGTISGTPTSVQGATTYTLTGSNAVSTSSANFQLTVLINVTSLSMPSLTTATYKSQTSLVITIVGSSGKVTFFQNGKRISGCINVATVTSGSTTATCKWLPSVMNYVYLSAEYKASSAVYTNATLAPMRVFIQKRSNTR